MNDPRLIEIEFLAALERERPSGLTWWEWAKKLGLGKEFFTDMVFGLFRDGCLEGTSTITAPGGHTPIPGKTDIRQWGQDEIQHSVRTLLSGANSWSAYINHAGRLRLWRTRDEVLKARTKDPFGLLWDKRHWDTDLAIRQAMSDAETPLTVMFIDVDNFKAVNEIAGHLVGDEVLRMIFQTTLDLVGVVSADAYRWGGDEITVLLPATTLEAATAVGEAIRRTVEQQCSVHPKLVEPGLKVTVSVGVGAVVTKLTPPEITARTSELMKTVKAAGKNNVSAKDLR
jgi:diguanylate cyclase (GGDEF)-like protein